MGTIPDSTYRMNRFTIKFSFLIKSEQMWPLAEFARRLHVMFDFKESQYPNTLTKQCMVW